MCMCLTRHMYKNVYSLLSIKSQFLLLCNMMRVLENMFPFTVKVNLFLFQ